jgi:Na+/phosphate symporter
MAENHLTTEKAEKRIKAITDHLESLQHAADFLENLANHKHDCEEETVSLSIDTLYFFRSIMDMAVDTISAELGLLKYAERPEGKAYVRSPQAAPEGGVS